MPGHAGARMVSLYGTPDCLVVESPRRRLEAGDLRYAEEKRAAGWGWQTIATCLRVHVVDLRMACGDLAAPVAPVEPAPPKPRPIGEGMKTGAAVLLAVLSGATNLIDAAVMTGRPTRNVSMTAAKLRNQGLLEGWALTPAGRREAKAWARETGTAVDVAAAQAPQADRSELKPWTQVARVLLAVAAGAATDRAAADQAGEPLDSVKTALARLRGRGFLRPRSYELTPAGAAEVAALTREQNRRSA